MNYFSMFTGIGGFELGIQRAFNVSQKRRGTQNTQRDDEKGNRLHTISSKRTSLTSDTNNEHINGSIDQRQSNCVGYSEIDKYAIQTYERNFNGHTNYGDATTINAGELPDFDLLVGGFPCQAFSIAGKRQGFDDTRGTLFFDVARILSEKRPRHLVLENVKGLLTHDKGQTFQTILAVLADLGYRVEWQVLNSKDFGVPQNRERVYIIGHLRGECGRQVLPITGESPEVIKQLNQPTHSNYIVYSGEGISPTLNTMQGGNRQPFIAPVLTPDRVNKSQNGRRIKKNGEPAFTVTAQDRHGIYDGVKIRRLTPKECERLQGFPDDWTAGVSDTQRYKQCGNAVTVNVVQAVIRQLGECL